MSPEDLGKVLSGLPPIIDPAVLVGIATNDDAAVYRLGDRALVATVDLFTPIVDDARDFGRISAANSLSDVYAMGARPLFALSIIGFPAKKLPLEMMTEILLGGSEKAAEAGIPIVGGHSIDDAEPKYGLSVIGVVDPDKVVRNSTARAGHLLVLTKPIGTGVISQGIKNGRAPADVVAKATASMARLNRDAAEAMGRFAPSAATDVTGFGLVGHLHEVAHASGVSARLHVADVPFLDGARELAAAGVLPGGSRRNLDYFGRWVAWDERVDETTRLLLGDAQTSGGLLVCLAPDEARAYAAATGGRIIGSLEAGRPGEITVEP